MQIKTDFVMATVTYAMLALISIWIVSGVFLSADCACRDVIKLSVQNITTPGNKIRDLDFSLEEVGDNLYNARFTGNLTKDASGKDVMKGCLKIKSVLPTMPICYSADLKKTFLKDKYIADTITACSNVKREVPVKKDIYIGTDCLINLSIFAPFLVLTSEANAYVEDKNGPFLMVNAILTKEKKCN